MESTIKLLKTNKQLKINTGIPSLEKKCIFAPLINRGREPQNLITRLCQ